MRAREFTQEDRQPNNGKLVIFDIDDTLVNTDTRVNVVRAGRVVKQLNSHDFTHYKLQPGEEFDFGAFRDAREFFTKARPIPGMIRRLKQDIATGNRVIMLTARSDFNDREVFLDTFRQYGIDMSKVHVYRAGNLNVKAATEEKKKIILRHLLGKEHYDKVIMYDDSVPNLNAFLSLKQDYPWSRFYAWHVDPSGKASEYHRSDMKESGHSGLSYIGNCTEDDIVDDIFGSVSEFARQVELHGDEFEIDDLVVKYDSDKDIHYFYHRLSENFADGKKPGRRGLAKRMGVNCKQPVSKLRSIAANSSGERQRMAHWCANMKSGRSKNR